ncbi:MAG: hypothetical protein MJ192_07430, partial [Clostridia bacterium]|nr:hypothetical protein [Clostridia bacterium]
CGDSRTKEFCKILRNLCKQMCRQGESRALRGDALRHYRTMMTVQMRRQKFRQMKQNSARAVTPARRNFVKGVSKYSACGERREDFSSV